MLTTHIQTQMVLTLILQAVPDQNQVGNVWLKTILHERVDTIKLCYLKVVAYQKSIGIVVSGFVTAISVL